MIRWAVLFLILAVIAGFFGYSGLAAVSIEAARIIFGFFLVLFIIAMVIQAFRGKKPPI